MLFKAPDLDPLELEVIADVTKLGRDLRYFTSQPRRWNGLLSRNALARAVQGSNSIEGYNVSMEDAIAAVEGQEPIDPKDETWMAVAGYRMALTFVLQKSDDPDFRYSEEVVKSLHYMMVGFDLSKHPGRWRPGSIFVKRADTGEQVYEGPPAGEVQELIAELVEDLNASSAAAPLHVRAAMAHLNLVMIHPFSDGNGRMARGLQTLVLARGGIITPAFSSIEEYLGRWRAHYYAVLGEVGAGSWHPERDARPWIRFCLRAHHHQAQTLLRRSRDMQRLWDAVEERANALGLPERSMAPLVDAAYGLPLRNATYRAAADVKELVATRDLKQLVATGLLEGRGQNRGRHYVASNELRELRRATAEPKAGLADPFATSSSERTSGPGVLPGMERPVIG